MPRKPKHFVASDGKQIFGLARDARSGRWRILATGQTFNESDEKRAIERFYRLSPTDDATGFYAHQPTQNSGRIDWAAVADAIRTKPQWVAQQTGIEQIAYLTALKAPEALPSLKQLEKLWTEKATCSPKQKREVQRAFRIFSKQIESLADLTPQKAVSISEAINRLPFSPKTVSKTINNIRRVFSFAKSKAISPVKMSEILSILEIMECERQQEPLLPHPLTKEEWQKLFNAATDNKDRAMLLLMLNGAYSIGEVVRLRWEEIKDGCIITHRTKTARVIRACVLWAETIAALELLPKKGEYILTSATGVGYHADGIRKRWARLAGAAGLDATSSSLRDSAQTAAAGAGVDIVAINSLAGHRNSGETDKYVARNPRIVAKACQAIKDFYL